MDEEFTSKDQQQQCLVSLGNGAIAALGGFPDGNRPSAFQAETSQVRQGWDINCRCGWSCFTSLVKFPNIFNQLRFWKFHVELISDMKRSL